MEQSRKEIKRIKGYRLEYYESLFDVVDTYIEEKPDITIETCKSIIEGISKLTLHVLKQEPLHKLEKSTNFQDLFKTALNELQNRSPSPFEKDLTNRLGSVVHRISEMRNVHGDISHGKASLKEQVNDSDLSEMVIGVTDSIGSYMLRKLGQIVDDDEVEYDANQDFNESLDELYPLDGNLKYSKALYEQDPISYEEQLDDFNLEYGLEE